MEPWVSWVLFGTSVAAAGGYYYTQSQRKIARAREVAGRRRGSQARVDTKEKRTKGRESGSSDHVASDSADVPSTAGSGVESVQKRKGNRKQPSKLAQSSAPDLGTERKSDVNDAEDEGIDNVEFARQFSSKQVGTDLKKSAGPAEKQRSQKQSKHNKSALNAINGNALRPSEMTNLQQPSTVSSNAGADADDDLSPFNSPELGATPAPATSGMNVSDMLEPSTKGPSILNITAPANPQPVRQPKQQKPTPEPETKKQRQNRRKKEEQRAAREDDEKQRRILLEKQLRTAREAEGRPAKNGLGISNGSTGNAWNKLASANGDVKASTSSVDQNEIPFLDTFDDSQSSGNGATSFDASAVDGGSSSKAPSPSTFTSNTDLPSEEEQLRLISEMDSDNTWNTVNKGGKGKKSKLPAASDEASKATSYRHSTMQKPETQRTPSKFAALDVEHSTDESTSLDKVEEVTALDQSTIEADSTSFDNVRDKYLEDGALPPKPVDRKLTNHVGETQSTNTHANGSRNDGTNTRKSVTGLTIPDHVYPSPHEMWVTDDTPPEELPSGWYHYDNGCRYGNAKIPSYDREYERELHKHTQWAPDGNSYSHDHRMKAKRERDNYDKCRLIYRAHIARTIDLSQWNKDNIKQHPAYESDWPWALLPHPSEGWVAGFHDESRECNICEAFSR